MPGSFGDECTSSFRAGDDQFCSFARAASGTDPGGSAAHAHGLADPARTAAIPARLTGILLVGGASRRFGSPKALARFGAETLAERAWRLLGEVCDERIAVGKTGETAGLPFPLLDDGTSVRAPIAGLVAGLRAAANEVCVVLPVDCPLLEAGDLLSLAAACRDAAAPPTGPLPGAYRKSALPVLARRLADSQLTLRDALAELDATEVELDPTRLANVNTPAELELLRRRVSP